MRGDISNYARASLLRSAFMKLETLSKNGPFPPDGEVMSGRAVPRVKFYSFVQCCPITPEVKASRSVALNNESPIRVPLTGITTLRC